MLWLDRSMLPSTCTHICCIFVGLIRVMYMMVRSYIAEMGLYTGRRTFFCERCLLCGYRLVCERRLLCGSRYPNEGAFTGVSVVHDVDREPTFGSPSPGSIVPRTRAFRPLTALMRARMGVGGPGLKRPRTREARSELGELRNVAHIRV